MPSSRRPTQKELSGVSVDTFCFVCAFLNLIHLLFVYYCFQFCVFMDVCVYLYAHMHVYVFLAPFIFFNSGLFVFYLLTCFLKKEKEGIGLDGWEGVGPGRDEGEKLIRIYCMGKAF